VFLVYLFSKKVLCIFFMFIPHFSAEKCLRLLGCAMIVFVFCLAVRNVLAVRLFYWNGFGVFYTVVIIYYHNHIFVYLLPI
jgi:hypothetical protein